MPAGRLTLVLCMTDSVTMGEIWSSFSVGILGLKEVSRSPFSCLRQGELFLGPYFTHPSFRVREGGRRRSFRLMTEREARRR